MINKKLEEIGYKSTEPASEADKLGTWKEMYEVITIDEPLFSQVEKYMSGKLQSFTKGESEYSVIINGSKFDLPKNRKNQFLNDLREYLKSKKLDRTLIEKFCF